MILRVMYKADAARPHMHTPSLGWCRPTHMYRAGGSPASNVNGDSGRDGDGMGENILDQLEGGGPDHQDSPPPISTPAYWPSVR